MLQLTYNQAYCTLYACITKHCTPTESSANNGVWARTLIDSCSNLPGTLEETHLTKQEGRDRILELKVIKKTHCNSRKPRSVVFTDSIIYHYTVPLLVSNDAFVVSMSDLVVVQFNVQSKRQKDISCFSFYHMAL